MKLTATSTVDATAWDATVAALGGTACHSSAYVRFLEAAEPNARPSFLTLAAADGTSVGAAACLTAQSPHRLLRPVSTRLWLPSLPALGSDGMALLPEFLAELEAYARAAGIVVLEVESAGSPGGHEALARGAFSSSDFWEFELDLRPSEEELWQALEYKRRKNIKKALGMGVEVKELPHQEGLAHLRRLQVHSSKRIVARGGPDIAAKRDRSSDPAAHLLNSGMGRVVGASVDGEVVSAGLFTCFNGLVYHTLSGHSETALRSQAPTLLLWETIKWYKNAGAVRFNFGGCSRGAEREGHPEHGVYVYKLGFGGERLECTSGRKILRPVRYAARQVIRMATGR